MSIRVSIARGCTGMGSCARLAPNVFRIDPASGRAEVLLDDCSEHHAGVLAAAQACPMVLVETDGVPASEAIEAATVIEASRLTPDILGLRLRLRRGSLAFVPGQYVFLRLTDDAGDFFRTYSVVTAEQSTVSLCIRLVPNGRAGRVLAAIGSGVEVGLSRAKGLFALETPDRPKLFVTGGTGLAPVLPMCRAAPGARKLVVVGARSPRDLFWRAALAALPNTTVVEVVQHPEPGWTGPVGLVTAPLEALDIAEWPEVYTCGSPGMVEAVRRCLVAKGAPADSIRSDSFLAAGMPSDASRKPTAEPPRGRDWGALLRRTHYIASAPLALLILFYAVTGFVANRSSLFEGEGTGQAEHAVPQGVALDATALPPVLAAMLPSGVQLDDFEAGEDPTARFSHPDGRAWSLRVFGSSRTVRIEECGTLPAGTALDPAAVASVLAGRLSGDPDLDHASVEDGEVELDISSVWGSHHVHVDPTSRTWTATSSRQPLVVALTDIHRGKHAGAWQKILIDATGLVLAFVSLSGTAMSLLAAAPGRRRMAMLLLSASAILLATLVLNR